MIRTSRTLASELARLQDDFLIVKYGDIELVIETIGRAKIHGDRDNDNMTCLCLIVRDGGQGCIKR